MLSNRTSILTPNFGIRLNGVDKISQHYRARDYDDIKIYVEDLKKVGDDDTVLNFGVGSYNDSFGDFRTRISNKKFGEEVLLEKEEVRGLNPYNVLKYALQSTFGRISTPYSLDGSRYGDYSFKKLKICVENMEMSFLENICEKHNLSPKDALKKYNVTDGHWDGIACQLENNILYKKDSYPARFRPDYGNQDLVRNRNEALHEVLCIVNEPRH